jgi:hypothetical protein
MHKLNSTQKQNVVTKAIRDLDHVSHKREQWQPKFDGARAELHGLLADCLAIYSDIKGTSAEKEVMTEIKDQLVKNKLPAKKGASVIRSIVYYVFKSDRRRVSGYARVLAYAIQEGVSAQNFSEWVVKDGGIEEISRTKAATPATQQKNAVIAQEVTRVSNKLDLALQSPLAVIPKSELYSTEGSLEYTLLVGKTMANGETCVLSIVPNVTQTMIDAAIKKIAEGYISLGSQEVIAQKQEARDAAFASALKSIKPDRNVKHKAKKRFYYGNKKTKHAA